MGDSKTVFKYRTVRGFSLGFNGFEDDQDDGALDLARLNPFLTASSLGKVGTLQRLLTIKQLTCQADIAGHLSTHLLQWRLLGCCCLTDVAD